MMVCLYAYNTVFKSFESFSQIMKSLYLFTKESQWMSQGTFSSFSRAKHIS